MRARPGGLGDMPVVSPTYGVWGLGPSGCQLAVKLRGLGRCPMYLSGRPPVFSGLARWCAQQTTTRAVHFRPLLVVPVHFLAGACALFECSCS